jgi:Ran GTPase-activating protein (RanGAP) involved in mRNA processing and transport
MISRAHLCIPYLELKYIACAVQWVLSLWIFCSFGYSMDSSLFSGREEGEALKWDILRMIQTPALNSSHFELWMSEHRLQQRVESIQSLNVSRNNLGVEGAKALVIALKFMPNLQKLDVSWNTLHNEGAKILSVALRVEFPLQKLCLYGNRIGNEGLQDLAPTFGRQTLLKKLLLDQNCIGNIGAEALAYALRSMSGLQKLDLAQNVIETEGAHHIAAALPSMDSLIWLNIYKNDIGQAGTQEMQSSIEQMNRQRYRQQQPLLEVLGLTQSIDYTQRPLTETLVNELRADLLSWLHMLNRQPFEQWLKDQRYPLRQQLHMLKALYLSGHDIDDRMLQACIPALSTMTRLESLTLGQNAIGDAGIHDFITQALPKLLSLEWLYLSQNRISSSGVQEVEQVIGALNRQRALQNQTALQFSIRGCPG